MFRYDTTRNIRLIGEDYIPVAETGNGKFIRPFAELRLDGTYLCSIGEVANLHAFQTECIRVYDINQNQSFLRQSYNILRHDCSVGKGSADLFQFLGEIKRYFLRRNIKFNQE